MSSFSLCKQPRCHSVGVEEILLSFTRVKLLACIKQRKNEEYETTETRLETAMHLWKSVTKVGKWNLRNWCGPIKKNQIINRNQHLKSQLCLTFREHFYLQSQWPSFFHKWKKRYAAVWLFHHQYKFLTFNSVLDVSKCCDVYKNDLIANACCHQS